MNLKIVGVATSIVSLGAGLAAGYFIAKKQMEAKYEKISQEEIAEAKEYYSKLYKREQFDNPRRAADLLLPKELQPTFRSYQGRPPVVTEEDVTNKILRENLFTRVSELPDIEEEIRNRDETKPYIISNEEFMENDREYNQVSVVYYEGDGILADDREDVIDVEETLGSDNVVRFGHRSDDENVVYIRNPVLEIEYEVNRSTGKYSEEVMGLRAD